MKKFIKVKPTTDDQTREMLAMLRILALGERQVAEGKVTPASEVFRRLRKKRSHS